ncbi:hypothetical protein L5515_016356 [Caenorhabditis briggsae]|uniref:Uncharacterized protein n=1 Tax=Caenorhabditis briggsae TaxID=6238 RepID=A0AAE9FAD5_CAEBR|nr:hypothetical protein L5515_016356 [Caenorhabditis briggsae]
MRSNLVKQACSLFVFFSTSHTRWAWSTGAISNPDPVVVSSRLIRYTIALQRYQLHEIVQWIQEVVQPPSQVLPAHSVVQFFHLASSFYDIPLNGSAKKYVKIFAGSKINTQNKEILQIGDIQSSEYQALQANIGNVWFGGSMQAVTAFNQLTPCRYDSWPMIVRAPMQADSAQEPTLRQINDYFNLMSLN